MIGPYLVIGEPQRLEAWGQPCTDGDVDLVNFVLDGRTYKVNRLGAAAWAVWESIRRKHDYHLTGNDTGFYNCRHMRHDSNMPWSVHAWAMALDVNWLENPAGSKLVTDIPKEMIDDLLGVRTNSGARVFRWGGDWDWDGYSFDHSYVDAMHWEVVAHPLDLATGIKVSWIDGGDSVTPEAAEFWQKVYDDLQQNLDPDTNETWARTLIEAFRAGKTEGQDNE